MTTLKRKLTVIHLPANVPSCVFFKPQGQAKPVDRPDGESWFCGKCGKPVLSGIWPESIARAYPQARQIILECSACHAYNVAPSVPARARERIFPFMGQRGVEGINGSAIEALIARRTALRNTGRGRSS